MTSLSPECSPPIDDLGLVSKAAKLSFNVIGYVSSNLGVGAAARNYIRVLCDRGHDVAVLDIDPGFNRKGADLTYAPLTVADPRQLPHSVNLVVLDVNALPQLVLGNTDGLFRSGRLNAVLPWWELTVLPSRCIDALRCFDVILTGSAYIHHLMAFNVPGTRIVRAEHPAYLPAEAVQPDRARFGLPEGPVLFLSSFEPLSGVQRKNPFAAVKAFQLAFPDRSDARARLVIKLNNAANSSIDLLGGFFEQIHEMRRRDSRLLLINESLSYADVLKLYATCDVFVSLHRSEGLGLGPLEAMRLGRAVIATGWSGNMSYMDYANACLVSYRFIAAGGDPYYERQYLGKPAFWADPDVAEASEWMKALADDRALREQFGNRARESTERYHREAQKATFVDQIHAIMEQAQRIATKDGSRVAHVSELRRTELARSIALLPAWKRRRIKALATLERHLLWRFRAR